MFAKVYSLSRAQTLPIGVDACWEFFSNPSNLPLITPPWLSFEVGALPPGPIKPGQIFQYRLRPLLGVPITWVTEITHVVPGELFVDEQRYGPYAMWHHQHHFRATESGTEVEDIVHYVMPLGPLGRLVRRLTVAASLDEIFEYRFRVLEERFGRPVARGPARARQLGFAT